MWKWRKICIFSILIRIIKKNCPEKWQKIRDSFDISINSVKTIDRIFFSLNLILFVQNGSVAYEIFVIEFTGLPFFKFHLHTNFIEKMIYSGLTSIYNIF